MEKLAEKTQEYHLKFINENSWWFDDATVDDRESIIECGYKMKKILNESLDAKNESDKIKNMISENNQIIIKYEETIRNQDNILLQKGITNGCQCPKKIFSKTR